MKYLLLLLLSLLLAACTTTPSPAPDLTTDAPGEELIIFAGKEGCPYGLYENEGKCWCPDDTLPRNGASGPECPGMYWYIIYD